MIADLDELQTKFLKTIDSFFPEDHYISKEDLLAKAASEISVSASRILEYFYLPTKKRDSQKALPHLKNILKWSTVIADLMEVECPTEGEIDLFYEGWPDVIVHDGILAAICVNNRVAGIVLDYFTEDIDDEVVGDDIWGLFSLVDLLSQRIGLKFDDVLRYATD